MLICDGYVWFWGVLFGPIMPLLALLAPVGALSKSAQPLWKSVHPGGATQTSGPGAPGPRLVHEPQQAEPNPTSCLNRKLKYRLKFASVFDLFPAKLCPRSPPDGSGSKNGAERT